MTSPFAYNLEYLEAAAELLERYLLSEEIYWQLNGRSKSGPQFPSLTLGGILLAMKLSHALAETSEQSAKALQITAHIDHARTKWMVAWENKAAREFSARLTLWRDFLEEFRQDPEGNVDRYAYEVGRRVMLSLLQDETKKIPPAEQELLGALDHILNSYLVPSEFVWDRKLKPAFPEDEYPYLYGVLCGISQSQFGK